MVPLVFTWNSLPWVFKSFKLGFSMRFLREIERNAIHVEYGLSLGLHDIDLGMDIGQGTLSTWNMVCHGTYLGMDRDRYPSGIWSVFGFTCTSYGNIQGTSMRRSLGEALKQA